ALFLASGSEHDDRGVITENQANRTRMMQKRAQKLETFAKHVSVPPTETVGPKDAKIGVITWGSTTTACDEAIARLPNHKIRRTAVKLLWPFPHDDIKKLVDACD